MLGMFLNLPVGETSPLHSNLFYGSVHRTISHVEKGLHSGTKKTLATVDSVSLYSRPARFFPSIITVRNTRFMRVW
jgi:hypothetical protein